MPAAAARAHVENALPFLKWAGGKSRLLKQYQPYLPRRQQIRRYYEPFIGSAALFFHLQPAAAVLSDNNDKLVEAYRLVQQDVAAVIGALRPHVNEEGHYYLVRAQDPACLSPAERAARLIYLNRTCYNGLFRENRRGEFNVPFGRYNNPTICDEKRLRTASDALQGVALCVADFEAAVRDAGPGDFVYLDPPYAPVSATSSFTSYNRHGFSDDDQARLAQTFHRLAGRGCRVLLSNASVPLIYDLYGNRGYRLVPIQARRNINSKADGRGPVKELLIVTPA